jgi:hypothetical protein
MRRCHQHIQFAMRIGRGGGFAAGALLEIVLSSARF